MKQKIILILSSKGANNSINALCTQFESLFHQAGKTTYFLDISEPDFAQSLQDAVVNYEIEFAFSYLGFGSEISWQDHTTGKTVNIWEHFGIPFIKLQGDSPAYFIQRHGPVPATSINMYSSPEFADLQSWFYQPQRTPYFINKAAILDQQAIEKIDFKQRAKGTLLFLKNGNDPDQLTHWWQERLPTSMATDLFDLAQALLPAALACKPFNIFQTVFDHVDNNIGEAYFYKDIVRLYIAQLDDFFRRLKATFIAQSLKKFPVKIIGNHWEHVKDSHTIAEFSNHLNFAQHSQEIFANALGLIDMTPNFDNNIHDRFCRAAGNYTFVFTNKTSWMQQNLPEFNDYTYIFDQDAFESQIEFLLNNKDFVVEQGKLLGTLAKERINSLDFVQQLIDAAEKMRFLKRVDKPALQEFYIW